MPLVAVLLFLLVPLVALVIDLGMVTLTRRQMQTAVNVGALEGLRVRDNERFGTLDEKRAQVQSMVAHAMSGSGLGPNINFENGTALPGTDFLASRTIDTSTLGPYRPPLLELNRDNDPAGDMVSGNWQADGASTHVESSDYQRDEFEVVPPGQILTANAFMVRLRRVSGESPVEGVSTVGPPVPFLFGRGPYGATDLLDRRERGTNLRATAIASDSGSLAGTVGRPQQLDSFRILGAAPLAIAAADWPLLMPNTQYTIDLQTGDVSDEDDTLILNAERLQLSPHVAVAHPIESMKFSESAAVPLEVVSDVRFYVPLFTSVTTSAGAYTVRVVVGFGCIRLTHAEMSESATAFVEESIVGPENCSATIAYSSDALLDAAMASEPSYSLLGPEAQRAVRAELIRRSIAEWRGMLGHPQILRAPALVRSIH